MIKAAEMATVMSSVRFAARCLVKGSFVRSTLTNASAAAATKLVHITQTHHNRQFHSLTMHNKVRTVTLAPGMKIKEGQSKGRSDR